METTVNLNQLYKKKKRKKKKRYWYTLDNGQRKYVFRKSDLPSQVRLGRKKKEKVDGRKQKHYWYIDENGKRIVVKYKKDIPYRYRHKKLTPEERKKRIQQGLKKYWESERGQKRKMQQRLRMQLYWNAKKGLLDPTAPYGFDGLDVGIDGSYTVSEDTPGLYADANTIFETVSNLIDSIPEIIAVGKGKVVWLSQAKAELTVILAEKAAQDEPELSKYARHLSDNLEKLMNWVRAFDYASKDRDINYNLAGIKAILMGISLKDLKLLENIKYTQAGDAASDVRDFPYDDPDAFMSQFDGEDDEI